MNCIFLLYPEVGLFICFRLPACAYLPFILQITNNKFGIFESLNFGSGNLVLTVWQIIGIFSISSAVNFRIWQ